MNDVKSEQPASPQSANGHASDNGELNPSVSKASQESHPVFQRLPPPEGSRDYIRLLRVLPAESSEDPLVCALSAASLDEKPEYAALSYTWGEPIFDHKITLNGSPFMISTNLHDALRTFRDRKHQVIWVDAVCINQSNFDERNRQVLLMQRIYALSTFVLVYLGDIDLEVTDEEAQR